ncbi:MSP (major sperm protein) domain protein (macronuclear) [Tetrahymena thermophila SB210]|uniref:MSP (Major sperm protein) domain protein n=1 Tax=Tetrahymena thermophila (strain SB210) TaxID=312017 RepID=Q22KH0_TETTS|nr:MSP (major sperm protein) domain protein [Tetrahymena thermophila SB210]EAR85829.1 MSP (major sperm protein) domain protein [Tetrahymena thermophila SB210]|eukprot:XP_001033492.1 MSP (major sperm protein) domain protein [Tetrahymena thermophila SB210]
MKVLDISVTEVQFQFVEDKQLSSKITLKNKAKLPVYFKIKTTGQQYFNVKPYRGLLEPSKGVDIDITIKPISYRDAEIVSDQKFLVSGLEIENKTSDDKEYDTMWKNAEKLDPNPIESQRLKVALYKDENGIKKFITNSRTDNTLKQSKMYQSVRSNSKQDNNLVSLDQDNQQRRNFEEIGKKYIEVEKKIREQEKERNRLHQQLLKLKQQKTQTLKGSNEKTKIILMALLGFIISYIILK